MEGTLVKVHPDTVNSRQIKGEPYKEIDKLQIGDLVLSANEHTGELSYRPVTELFVHDVKLIHRLTYKEGLTIETTWNHPFWVQDKGWTEAKDLHAGERSVTARSILKGKQPKLQTVSFTSNVQPGFDDPSLVTWDDAKEGTLAVAGVEEVHRADKVYNIEVEGNHTYFVTEEGVLVHNYSDEAIAYRLQLSEQSKAQLELATANRQAMAELRQTQQEIIARCMPGCLDAQGKFDVNRLSDSDHSLFTSATAGIGQLDTQAREAERAAAMYGQMRENVYDDGLKPASEQTRELGFFDSMGQRFSNWWDTPGLFNGSFRTDSELISSARESLGARAEIAMVERLGYAKTGDQLKNEALLDYADQTRATLREKYRLAEDGPFDRRLLNNGDRDTYYTANYAEASLVKGADRDALLARDGFAIEGMLDYRGNPNWRVPSAPAARDNSGPVWVVREANVPAAQPNFWIDQPDLRPHHGDYPNMADVVLPGNAIYGPASPFRANLTLNPGYGGFVSLDNGIRFAHMQEVNAEVIDAANRGTTLPAGTYIGRYGPRGGIAGEHLHMEGRYPLSDRQGMQRALRRTN